MAAMINQIDTKKFYVVHPLDDIPEQKCNPKNLGRMHMSPTVKTSLMALRGYLVVIVGLAGFHILSISGALVHH